MFCRPKTDMCDYCVKCELKLRNLIQVTNVKFHFKFIKEKLKDENKLERITLKKLHK